MKTEYIPSMTLAEFKHLQIGELFRYSEDSGRRQVFIKVTNDLGFNLTCPAQGCREVVGNVYKVRQVGVLQYIDDV